MKDFKAALAVFIFVSFFSVWGLAQDVRVEASVDRNEMGVGDTVELSVTVSSSDEIEPSPVELPSLNGFEVVAENQQTSVASRLMQGPNGMEFKTQRRIEYIFMLAAQQAGVFTIPAITVSVSGKKYSTQPIRIRVDKEGSGSSQIPNQPNFPQGLPRGLPQGFEDLEREFLNQLQRQQGGGLPQFTPEYKDVPKNPKEAFSVQLELDKTTAFEGEQIMARWVLYTRGNILSMDRVKFPELKGFWKEILEEIPQLNFTEEIVNGVPYRKALLAAHALFPIKVGTAVIDEYKIRASVQTPNSQFGSFGFGPAFTYNRSSQRVEIKVKPLPTTGKPNSFSGAIGRFEAATNLSDGPISVGQPFSLKLRVQGVGNAKLIEMPSVQYPAELEVYDTRSESRFLKDGTSFKEFEVLLIPKAEGKILIPSFEFSYFNPQTERYETQKLPELAVEAGPASASQAGGDSRIQSSKKSVVKNELPAPVALWPEASAFNQVLEKPMTWGFALLTSLITFIAGWFLVLREKKETRSLLEEFTNRQTLIESHIKAKAFEKAGAEMLNLINSILGRIAGLKGGSVELSLILKEASPQLRQEYGDQITELSDLIQRAIFSGESIDKAKVFSEYKVRCYSLIKDCIKKSESEIN